MRDPTPSPPSGTEHTCPTALLLFGCCKSTLSFFMCHIELFSTRIFEIYFVEHSLRLWPADAVMGGGRRSIEGGREFVFFDIHMYVCIPVRIHILLTLLFSYCIRASFFWGASFFCFFFSFLLLLLFLMLILCFAFLDTASDGIFVA